VLHQFVAQFGDGGSGLGSYAAFVETNSALLDQLGAYPALNGAVAQEKAHVRKWVESAKQQEAGLDKLRDDRFEW
jgi:2-oxo-4-hydroxy-4-carboxy--5-ureidoimidazoline (OHCU) decarboxylase